MKQNCDCSYCKNNVNEYFCIQCGYNFNECESLFKYDEINPCPKCYPYREKFWMSPVRDRVNRRWIYDWI